jgi:hypothetical protein
VNYLETKEAIKYWAFISAGLFFCVYIGKLFAETGSIYIPIFFVALAVAGVTFYSPRAALGFIVFSMLLSPKIPGMQIAQGGGHSLVVVRFDDLLLAIVIFSWLARTAIIKQSSFLLSTPLNLPIFLYTSACVVSTFFGIMAGRLQVLRSLFYVLKYVEYFFLYFMTVNIVQSRNEIRQYLWYGWITAVVVTLYGYMQIPSGERVTAPFEAPLGATSVEKAGASEPNTLGGYYVVVFSLLFGFYTQSVGAISLFSISSFLFMFLPFIYTKSRSSYMGLAASLICHMIMTPRRRLALLLGIGCAAVVAFSVPKVRQTVVDRIMYTFTGHTSKGETNDVYTVGGVGDSQVKLEGSAAARYFAWKRILFTQFPKHPIFGWGVTGVGLSDTQYPLVIGETGLLGLCLFMWMLIRIWKCALYVLRSSKDSMDQSLAIGLMTALAGLIVHGLGANTFIIVRIMEPFWFIVALIARLYMDQRQMQGAG